MDTCASFNENDELIKCCKSDITLIVDETTFGKGTLYVTESKLYWKNDTNNQIISFNYNIICELDISYHPKVHKEPCIKIIVDFNYKPDDNEVDENEVDENEVDENKVDENKVDENKVDENKVDENEDKNKVDENKVDENEDKNKVDENKVDENEDKNKVDENKVDENKVVENEVEEEEVEEEEVEEEEVEEEEVEEEEVEEEEVEEEEKLKSIIKLVPDNLECMYDILEAISSIIYVEDEVEGSDGESNSTDTSSRESDEHLADVSLSESDEHEDSDKNSNISIKSTYTQEDEEAGSIDISNQYLKLDAKNVEKENRVNSIKCLDISHSSSDSLDDNEYSHDSENDILLQDGEVLINERKRKFEDLPEQEEKSTKIRKLWNFMKYPFQKITSFSTSISENEPKMSIDEVITEAYTGKMNSLEPETAVSENNTDSVKTEEKNSQNNSEADGENEDTLTNETSQNVCKIM